MANNWDPFVPTNLLFFIPLQNVGGATFFTYFLDPSSYDDPNQSSTYSYRQEDIISSRTPTVHKVILEYRDLGVCSLTVTLTATDDNNVRQSATKTVTIGTVGADKSIKTALIDLTITGWRPQLTFSRAAAGGPFSITKATIAGEVEEQHF